MRNPVYLIAGLGKTGLSVARYLQRKKQSFILFDTRKELPGLSELKASFPESPVYLESLAAEVLSQVSDVIASPGLPLDGELLTQARALNIPIYGDIECLAREIQAPIVAITGTNGKSTVTTLVGEMARAAGFSVAVAGNIGTPVLDRLDDGHHYDLWVLELSSFQLDLTHSLKARAATILNITPDHLDRHHTLDAYTQAKQIIYQGAETAIYNREDHLTLPSTEPLPTDSISFGKSAPNTQQWGLRQEGGCIYLAYEDENILSTDLLRIKGVHNWLNALAACALAESVGISRPHMLSVLSSFPGLEHRCQWVRHLDGVDWINDSKGTNVGATISAITGIGETLSGKIVLIAGGDGKGADFQELAQPAAENVRCVVLIGVDAHKIEGVIVNTTPVMHASSMDEAVEQARSAAKPGDVVLLSPACASFDMFRDYNHRGEVFTSSVNGL